MQTKLWNLKEAERPNPFAPVTPYYNEGLQPAASLAKSSCEDCAKKVKKVLQNSEEEMLKMSANWKFPSRLDSQVPTFEK